MATDVEILEESRRVRRLQIIADLVMTVLAQSEMTVEEAAQMVASTRRFALNLFPDKAQTYDMIYAPRFQRLMAEKYELV